MELSERESEESFSFNSLSEKLDSQAETVSEY